MLLCMGDCCTLFLLLFTARRPRACHQAKTNISTNKQRKRPSRDGIARLQGDNQGYSTLRCIWRSRENIEPNSRRSIWRHTTKSVVVQIVQLSGMICRRHRRQHDYYSTQWGSPMKRKLLVSNEGTTHADYGDAVHAALLLMFERPPQHFLPPTFSIYYRRTNCGWNAITTWEVGGNRWSCK